MYQPRKENDVILKIRPAPGPQDAKLKADRTATLNRLQTSLRAIHDLAQSPGWALFQEDLKAERFDLLDRQLASTDPTTLAKLVGSQMVVERFTNWIPIMAQELEAAAQSMTEDDSE